MPARVAALALLLSAATIAANTPRPPSRPLPVHDFATLTQHQAERLAGKSALYRIALDSRTEEFDGFTVVDCTSADAVHRVAWFLLGRELRGDAGTVEAVLRIIRHPASNGLPPLIQYRVTEAEVGPPP